MDFLVGALEVTDALADFVQRFAFARFADCTRQLEEMLPRGVVLRLCIAGWK